MRKSLRLTLIILVLTFALIGLIFTVVFVGMQFGVFNVRGAISQRNDFFTQTKAATPGVATSTKNTPNIPCADERKSVCAWNETKEWATVKGGLEKDAPLINSIAEKTQVPARLIAAIVVPEQIRFFTAEREVFKRYFEPLKILGSLTKFSLGVSGIKQDTALQIEQYASDLSSPFYPGKEYAPLIAYTEGTDHDTELYKRLTDDKNHYYSYLYTAIFIKEIETQWQNEGFDISANPGAIVTLFNIGFNKSKPNVSPQLGGAEVQTGGSSYTYGELGSAFYNSEELSDVFSK